MSIPLSEALKFWAKLGLISFGGPAGQIAVLHQELVEKRRWISERRFFHALNYCMILPGPEAQQLVTYIGWLMHRSMGGVLAGSLFILPSFFSFIGLAWIYITFGQIPWIAAIFFGIKPAITAIVPLQPHFEINCIGVIPSNLSAQPTLPSHRTDCSLCRSLGKSISPRTLLTSQQFIWKSSRRSRGSLF